MDQLAQIAAIVIGVIALLGIVYKAVSWKIGIDKDNEYAKSERAALGKSVDSIVSEIRNDIKNILLILDPKSTVKSNSPITLNDYGEKIAKRLKVQEWADRVAYDVIAVVKSDEPYEIAAYCALYLDEWLQFEEEWRKVQKFAYEEGINITNVKVVYEVILRDTVIKLKKTEPNE